MPPLPKIKKHKEADASLKFRKWLEENPLFTASFEMKYTSTDSIPFSALEEAQVNYGLAIREKKNGVLIRVDGTKGEPDYIYMRNEPSFVVVRYPKSFEIIAIPTWVRESKASKRRSLTWERARSLSTYSVNI